MIENVEPEGWYAECWPALYEPVMMVGVPWRLAVGQFMIFWVPLGFWSGHPLLGAVMACLTHWALRKLHEGDPQFAAITFRSFWFRRHWIV